MPDGTSTRVIRELELRGTFTDKTFPEVSQQTANHGFDLGEGSRDLGNTIVIVVLSTGQRAIDDLVAALKKLEGVEDVVPKTTPAAQA